MLRKGDIIDKKYRVVRLIGEGGMGEVYEGVNTSINRRVAIKVMHPSVAKESDGLLRFEREAKAASRIGSRHIPTVFDLGDLRSGERYMMEFLDGESLASRLAKVRRMSADVAAMLILQLLEGLTKVYAAGIVHRDLKPGNVFLVRDEDGRDQVKILHFGICKMTKSSRASHADVTGVGDLLGTPVYMSPEQLEHGPTGVDARSDIYSVGILLYRSVAGKLPYRGKTIMDVLTQLRSGGLMPLAEVVPDVDPRFAAIVDKAIEWSRDGRFQTAADFKGALERWLGKRKNVNKLLSEFLSAEDDGEPDVYEEETTRRLPTVKPPPKRRPSRIPPKGPPSIDATTAKKTRVSRASFTDEAKTQRHKRRP